MGLMSVDNGAGSKKQPVANIFLNKTYVMNDRTYSASAVSSYSDCFSVDGSALTCKKAGIYHVVGEASFRYGNFYIQVNSETKITVNGMKVMDGGIKTAEGDITLAVGDVVSASTSFLNQSDTRIAVGNAHIFKA